LNPLKKEDKNLISVSIQIKVASAPSWFYYLSQNSALNELALSFCFVGLRGYFIVLASSK
jgi:hypothetical protein